MDCCRTSLRLGADDVKVMARKPRQFFKASPWELEDAEDEKTQHHAEEYLAEEARIQDETLLQATDQAYREDTDRNDALFVRGEDEDEDPPGPPDRRP